MEREPMPPSPVPPNETSRPTVNESDVSRVRGRWKIGAALFAVACLAQAILWYLWWEDPTHFKMSLLFVWPAAIFFLLVWWTFFSGWKREIRFGAVGVVVAAIAGFFYFYKLDRFDGDMVPTRVVRRSTPTAEEKARSYLEQLAIPLPAVPEKNIEPGPLVATDSDWPGYRGPARDSIVRDVELRTDWESHPPKEIWRHPLGKAWSSFAVVGEMAFTQEQRGDREAVVAYRLADGETIWVHSDDVRFSASDAQGGDGPRATPQFDGGRLYTLGGTGLLNCLDAATGRRLWSADILKDAGTDGKPAANLGWGMAGSPLVVDGLVIVQPGGTNGHSVAAYNTESGKREWSAGDRACSYCSPRVETIQGVRQILAFQATGLSALSLKDGTEFWFFPLENGPKVNAAQPLVLSENSVIFGCGYGVGTVRVDVSHSKEEWPTEKRWQSNRFRPKFNDFVFREGHIYGLDDGTLTCLDVETGTVAWKSGRYGYGQILLVGGVLLILSEDGRVVQVPATPAKPEPLASFQALDSSGITWNHPVLVRGKLLVRNGNEAACFNLE
jgi:outer membrane protein assembly factor BamB